ncbi:DUF2797 domain-containing protein [Candidatus Gracilibacteria bacterium]|nr:DUF2797 domain-containing protein [Candidatus Gracilibacteria bacterium]
MKVHLFDFRWVDENTCEFQASSGNKFGYKKLKIGDNLSIEVKSDQTQCAGSMIDDLWSPCPDKISGKAKCQSCRNRERSFIFTAFDGFDRSNVTEQDLAQIKDSHLVYLALFNKDLIKVGVSKLTRRNLRQLEQGSHFTLFISQTPDGITARQIETLLRKNGLQDKIKPTQKKDFLCPDITETEGRNLLQDTCKNSLNTLQEYDHLKPLVKTESAEFVNWTSYYNIVAIEKSLKSFHSVKLQKDEWVSGKIIAIKGPFLVIETPEELVFICAKDLVGHEIQFDEKSAGITLNTAFQKALF